MRGLCLNLKGIINMRKKITALAAALIISLSLCGCGEVNAPSGSTNGSSQGGSSSPDNNSGSGVDFESIVTTDPQTVKCGDITEENGVKVFDAEIFFGNAFSIGYHYIRSANGSIENAIMSVKPLLTTELREILDDPNVGGSSLSESDFKRTGNVYRMNEDKAKSLLGDLADTYSFDQYWKNLKTAELVSTEKISAEEARPRVEELFENMGKDQK